MPGFGRHKTTTAKAAKAIAAAAAAPSAYPLFECAMQAKDAQAVLSDVADDLRKGHVQTATLLSRVDLVLAFLQHASGGTKKASTGVMLQAVTDLSAKFVRTACGQHYEDVQQRARVNKKTTSSGTSDHVLRLRQLAKKVTMEPTAACDETKVVLSDSEGMPLVSETLVRLLPQRPCTQPTQVRASIVQHPEPIRGPDSAYHPLELQWIIRTYICPKDTEHEWVSGKHNARLRAHIVYWVEKGWLGGARLNVRLDNESVDLTKDGKAAFHRARTALKRHYDKIEQYGWKLKLNYWSQHGRPRVMTAAEREECCRRLHRAGYDVEFGDWDEAIHNHLRTTAAATGTTGPEFVPHASTHTIKSTMVLNDLNAGAMATKTGTTSTLTQTVVRQEAGQSIRATHQLAAVVFASNFFPIEATHPRWVEFEPTMTVDDKMVCEAAGCCMIPAQACMVSSTDATSEWIQLNAGPPKVNFPAQRLPGRVSDGGDAGSVKAASEAMDLTGDCDDPDELAMARATARLCQPDMWCDAPAPGLLPAGTAGAAPTHTVGNRFDAVKQASLKPANMVSMSLGVNIQLTFAAVSRVTRGVACALLVFTHRQLPAVLVHATNVPTELPGTPDEPMGLRQGMLIGHNSGGEQVGDCDSRSGWISRCVCCAARRVAWALLCVSHMSSLSSCVVSAHCQAVVMSTWSRRRSVTSFTSATITTRMPTTSTKTARCRSSRTGRTSR